MTLKSLGIFQTCPKWLESSCKSLQNSWSLLLDSSKKVRVILYILPKQQESFVRLVQKSWSHVLNHSKKVRVMFQSLQKSLSHLLNPFKSHLLEAPKKLESFVRLLQKSQSHLLYPSKKVRVIFQTLQKSCSHLLNPSKKVGVFCQTHPKKLESSFRLYSFFYQKIEIEFIFVLFTKILYIAIEVTFLLQKIIYTIMKISIK